MIAIIIGRKRPSKDAGKGWCKSHRNRATTSSSQTVPAIVAYQEKAWRSGNLSEIQRPGTVVSQLDHLDRAGGSYLLR
jgi:hypothetical protein